MPASIIATASSVVAQVTPQAPASHLHQRDGRALVRLHVRPQATRPGREAARHLVEVPLDQAQIGGEERRRDLAGTGGVGEPRELPAEGSLVVASSRLVHALDRATPPTRAVRPPRRSPPVAPSPRHLPPCGPAHCPSRWRGSRRARGRSSRASVSARTVAVRGTSCSSAISPKKPPGPTRTIWEPASIVRSPSPTT